MRQKQLENEYTSAISLWKQSLPLKQKSNEVQCKEYSQRETESDPHQIHPSLKGKMICFAVNAIYTERYTFFYCLSLLVASALLTHFSLCPQPFCPWEVWVWKMWCKKCAQLKTTFPADLILADNSCVHK